MKARMEISGVDAELRLAGHPGIVDGIDLGPFRGDRYRDRGGKPGELLVRPDRTRGTPFDRARVTRPHPSSAD